MPAAVEDAAVSEGLMYVKFSGMEDLVRLVASSATPFLLHTLVDNQHLYFVQTVPIMGKPMVYLHQSGEEIKKRYAVYNRFTDKVSYSDQMGSDGQSVYIPILEVEKTSILQRLPL